MTEEKFVYHLSCNLTKNQFNLVIKSFPLIKEGAATVFFNSGVGGEIRMFKSQLLILQSYNRDISLDSLQYTLYCTDDQLKEGKSMVINAVKDKVQEIEIKLKNAFKLIGKKIEEKYI